jgi:hypothetical protein
MGRNLVCVDLPLAHRLLASAYAAAVDGGHDAQTQRSGGLGHKSLWAISGLSQTH